jgi:hypothetical protein
MNTQSYECFEASSAVQAAQEDEVALDQGEADPSAKREREQGK